MSKAQQDIRIASDLVLPLNVVTQKLAFIGTSGSGKSYAAMKLAEGMLDCGAQIIGIDPVGIWWSLRLLADGKHEGYKQVRVFGGDHGDLPLIPSSGVLVGRILAERRISAVLDVSHFTTGEMKRFLTDFSEQFFQSKKNHKSPVHLFLEECQTYIPQDKTDREDPIMLNRWERLIKFFRNYGGGTSMISQQPQSVNKKCLNLADTLFALRTIGSHERDAIMKWVKDVVETEIDLVKNLPKLPTGTAHIWSPSWLGISRDIKILPKETFDAGKTPEAGVNIVEPKPLTPVDVRQLEAEMAEMIEKVKQDDPRELRKRIAELEKTKAVVSIPAAAVTEVIDREKMLEAQRAEIDRIVKGAIIPQVRKLLDQVYSRTKNSANIIEQARADLEKDIEALRDESKFSLAFVSDKGVREMEKAIIKVDYIANGKKISETGVALVSTPAKRVTKEGDSKLRDGALRMIAVLYKFHPASVTKDNLRSFVGMTSKGTFGTYLSNLQTTGMVTQSGEMVNLTDEGFGFGAQLPKAPATTDEMLSIWEPKLRSGAVAILKILISANHAIGKDDLQARSGMASKGTFGTYLSNLAIAGLVHSSKGMVQANRETLFL